MWLRELDTETDVTLRSNLEPKCGDEEVQLVRCTRAEKAVTPRELSRTKERMKRISNESREIVFHRVVRNKGMQFEEVKLSEKRQG